MKLILFLSLVIFSFQAYAQDKYVCKNGNTERIVEVLYTSPDSKVPCEVKYTKSDSSKILWNANNEIGYCESKAKTFAIKLTGFGWSCSGLDSEAVIQ